MKPINFPEANHLYRPPEGYDESQVATIHAHRREIEGGTLDGDLQVIVAWKPDERELQAILSGQPIFISMIGGLAPHCLTTSFEECLTIGQ